MHHLFNSVYAGRRADGKFGKSTIGMQQWTNGVGVFIEKTFVVSCVPACGDRVSNC
jgi:hypothetical protein